MFGKNQVASAFPKEDGSLLVNSIWYTIQGEGPDAGLPAIFLRLSRCNLRCYFCDTEFDNGEELTFQQVATKVRDLQKQSNCKLLVITGGEPLLQNIIPLVGYVNNALKMTVSVETAGTVWLNSLQYYFAPDRRIHKNLIVCSPKTPKLNERLAELIGAFKYVLKAEYIDDSDGLPAYSTQRPGKRDKLFRPPRDTRPIYVQPMDEDNLDANLYNLKVAAQVCMAYGYRLSVQMHKLAGVP